MQSQASFVWTPINRNLCYPTQNCWERISPKVFHRFNPETSLSDSDTDILERIRQINRKQRAESDSTKCYLNKGMTAI